MHSAKISFREGDRPVKAPEWSAFALEWGIRALSYGACWVDGTEIRFHVGFGSSAISVAEAVEIRGGNANTVAYWALKIWTRFGGELRADLAVKFSLDWSDARAAA